MFRAFWTFFAVAAVCVGMAFAVMSLALAASPRSTVQIDTTELTLMSRNLPVELSDMF